MNRRVGFNSKEIRNLFFQELLGTYKLEKWKELRELFSMPRSMLERYRSGKLTLPEELYKKLSGSLSEKDKLLFNKEIKYLDQDWGRIKAGKITYFKHKNIFDEGRKKAIYAISKKAKDRFDIYMPLSLELSYFIGLFIGDGFANKYGRYHQIQFTGDIKEKQFYESLFSDYCRKLFNIIPKIKNDKYSNAIRVNLYSVALFEMITKRFKISAGRKSHTVLIPEEILNSTQDLISSCIRGLYDAEGCVFLDKRKEYKKPYPRIELHMCNLALLRQVSMVLEKLGIHNVVGTSKKNLRVTVWGFEEVNKFVKKIGFSNPKQLDKLRLAGLV